MQILDIIVLSPQETFLVGHLAGPVKPGPWELQVNGTTVATLDVTGEAQIEAGRRGKLAPPRVLVCRGPVDKSNIDFTRDDVSLVRKE